MFYFSQRLYFVYYYLHFNFLGSSFFIDSSSSFKTINKLFNTYLKESYK